MKKNKNDFGTILLVCLIVVSSVIAFPTNVKAVEPKITDIIISNNAENILLYARLFDGFKTEMESAILAGVPTVFTLHLDVYQERSFMWDKNIIRREIKRTIKYDNLKKTFQITTNGSDQPAVMSDFESAQKAMADFSGIVASPLSALAKGNNYYITIRIKIDKVRLPLHMEYVLFFVSFWDFETALYKKNFSY